MVCMYACMHACMYICFHHPNIGGFSDSVSSRWNQILYTHLLVKFLLNFRVLFLKSTRKYWCGWVNHSSSKLNVSRQCKGIFHSGIQNRIPTSNILIKPRQTGYLEDTQLFSEGFLNGQKTRCHRLSSTTWVGSRGWKARLAGFFAKQNDCQMVDWAHQPLFWLINPPYMGQKLQNKDHWGSR